MHSIRSVGPALLLAIAFHLPDARAETAVPQSTAEIQLSFAPVVRRTAPAVVTIYGRMADQEQNPMRRFMPQDQRLPPGMRDRAFSSVGSGVIVRPEGIIVTNHHVTSVADTITVGLADGREYTATILLADPRADLAVLRLEVPAGQSFPYLEVGDSDAIETGDLVLAIGNPFGIGQTVTSGIVSAAERTSLGATDSNYFIQTDAAINSGNSGGALVDLNGRLIGINTLLYHGGTNAGGFVGLGFAVPARMVQTVISAALDGGQLVRAWLGLTGQDLTADLANALGRELPGGVIINRVHPLGPAAAAGLRPGDVILAVDGVSVRDRAGLRFRIGTLPIGRTARLTVLREGAETGLDFAAMAPVEDPPRNQTALSGRHPLSGATVVNLSPAVAQALGLPDEMDSEGGIVLESVERGSPAERAGLKAHDVLVRLNGRAVDRVSQLPPMLARDLSRWKLELRREGKLIVAAVAPDGGR